MRMVFLAAGQGTRLRPYTNDRPKCLVPLFGQPILEYGLRAARSVGIERLTIVTGYLADEICSRYATDADCLFNPHFETSNMVTSLLCALDHFGGEIHEDIIIAYTDIVYTPSVLEKLMVSTGNVSVVVDLDWWRLWSLRMENPLDDAESLKLGSDGTIVEIGRKPRSPTDIAGQYIGLTKLSCDFLDNFRSFYDALDPLGRHLEKTRDMMDMTTLLQLLRTAGHTLTPVFINGYWLEVDSTADLAAYESNPEYRRLFSPAVRFE